MNRSPKRRIQSNGVTLTRGKWQDGAESCWKLKKGKKEKHNPVLSECHIRCAQGIFKASFTATLNFDAGRHSEAKRAALFHGLMPQLVEVGVRVCGCGCVGMWVGG